MNKPEEDHGLTPRVREVVDAARGTAQAVVPCASDPGSHHASHARLRGEALEIRRKRFQGGGRFTASLLAVASALGYATLGIFALLGYAQHLSTVTMLTCRFTGAAIVFTLWVLVTRQSWPKRRDFLLLAGMGAVGYTAMAWFFFVGNRLAPVGLVSAAVYTYPAMVTAVLAALRWEQLNHVKLFALLGTGVGVVLIVLLGQGALKGGTDPLLGILAGLATAIVYTVYIVIGTPVLRRVTATAASAVVTGAAAATLLLIGLATKSLGTLEISDLWVILGLVGPPTVLAVAGFFLAMQKIGSGQASILSNVEPAGAVMLGWVVFGQTLAAGELVGVVLLIASAVLLRWEAPDAPRITRTKIRPPSGA